MDEIEIGETHRGFALGRFTDANGEMCSIQKSSVATEDMIWLGIEDANPKVLKPGEGWQVVEVPEGTIFTTRMHLKKQHAAALIPLLQKFVDTGELK